VEEKGAPMAEEARSPAEDGGLVPGERGMSVAGA
jgi:hypothetical protein